jgi:hypothetical protein
MKHTEQKTEFELMINNQTAFEGLAVGGKRFAAGWKTAAIIHTGESLPGRGGDA